MIYIITPYSADFKFMCRDHGLPSHFNNPEIMWIDHVQRLYGRLIHEKDKIIKGEQYADFDPKMLNAIEIELALRTKKR
jgi:hypothetical protein